MGEHTSPRELLRAVVAIDSPTGEEGEAAQRLVDYFRERGREARLDDVGNVRAPGDGGLLLTSHVDTVPGDIPVRVEGGDLEDPEAVLHGRGSVDAKGPLCAMAVAAAETGASFVGVVGEETDSRGARHLLETREEPGALVNGEPSGWDGVTLGYRGFVSGRYTARTPSGHASRPEPNAIQHATAWWARIEAAFAPGGGDGDDADDVRVVEQVTPTPTSFEGGLTDDGLAVEATVEAQFRVPIGSTVEEVQETAEGCLEAGGRGSADLAWTNAIPAVMVDRRSDLAGSFRGAIRRAGGQPSLYVKTGTSDMNLFAGEWDCPMVTYGPGDSDLDHTPDEHLPLSEFDRAVEVLVDVAERQLG